jgi:hypothetical protein
MDIKKNILEESEDFDWMEQGEEVVDSDYLIYSDDDSMGVANPTWLDDPTREWMFNGEVNKIIEFTVRHPKGIKMDKITEVVYEIYDDIINNDMDVDKLDSFFNIENGKKIVYINNDSYSRINLPEQEDFDWIGETPTVDIGGQGVPKDVAKLGDKVKTKMGYTFTIEEIAEGDTWVWGSDLGKHKFVAGRSHGEKNWHNPLHLVKVNGINESEDFEWISDEFNTINHIFKKMVDTTTCNRTFEGEVCSCEEVKIDVNMEKLKMGQFTLNPPEKTWYNTMIRNFTVYTKEQGLQEEEMNAIWTRYIDYLTELRGVTIMKESNDFEWIRDSEPSIFDKLYGVTRYNDVINVNFNDDGNFVNITDDDDTNYFESYDLGRYFDYDPEEVYRLTKEEFLRFLKEDRINGSWDFGNPRYEDDKDYRDYMELYKLVETL